MHNWNTTFFAMCQIIQSAEEDPKLGVVWSQAKNWEEAYEIARTVPWDTGEENYDDQAFDERVVERVFFEMLHGIDMLDTGWDSYEQLMEAFFGRKK
jgi:hypothetical protein